MKSFCNIYAQFDQTGERLPLEVAHLLGLGLVCDTAVTFRQIGKFTPWMKKLQAAGGLIAPTIYPPDLDPACTDPNWWRYSEEECLRLLRIAREKYQAFGLGEMVAVNTYTPGNTFVAACRKIGVRYILGFCAPIVIEDGDWRIAHYGSPLAPYFISDEDFRKPEHPGERSDPVMMMSMEMRNPLICLNHWSEGPWCPLNALAADRSIEPSDLPVPFLTIAQDWINQGVLSDRRMFFQINLQYFFTEKCFDHNRRALEWLASKQHEGLIETGSGQKWAEICRQAGGFESQTSYWRAEMPGFHTGNRAGIYPDVVVSENLKHQAVWQSPDPLPRRFYNYANKWEYPAFVPDGSAPASDDFSSLRVRVETVSEKTSCMTTVEIFNNLNDTQIQLMLWGGLGNSKEHCRIAGTDGWTFEPVKHPSGTGGAILATGIAKAGQSTLHVTADFTQTGKTYSKRWGSLLAAETFFLGNQPFTVLTAQTPEPFTVQVKISPPEYDPQKDSAQELNAQTAAKLESLCGNAYSTAMVGEQGACLSFDGTRMACWHRLWGITAEQLQISGIDEIETRLRNDTKKLIKEFVSEIEIAEPGYPVFGPLTDKGRWEISVGRAAGERERERVNRWFARQYPDEGETVVEAHPGIYLPYGGSITKTLGHGFDCIICREGYGFREQCVDYPQSWGWGVGGWVQWRHLNVELTGLKGRRGHVLHLLSFDPEYRGTTLRIHAYNPSDKKNTELCLRSDWSLPQGIDGRLSSSALLSLNLPEICYEWDTIGLWISPVEKSRLYDWVHEKGSPGMLSHLWVTKEE